MHETVLQIPLVRHIFETAIDFASVLDAIYSGISRPGIEDLFEKLAAASTYEKFAALVAAAEGSAGLMRFMQLDLDDAVTLAIYPATEEAMLTAQALDAEVLTLLRRATQR